MNQNGSDRKRSFIMYLDYAQDFEDLTDEELGAVFRALFSFLIDGVVPDFKDRTLKHIYNMMARQAERDMEEYMKRCEKNKRNAQERWDKDKESNTFNPDDAARMVSERIRGR